MSGIAGGAALVNLRLGWAEEEVMVIIVRILLYLIMERRW